MGVVLGPLRRRRVRPLPSAPWRWVVRRALELSGVGAAPQPPGAADRRRRVPGRAVGSALSRVLERRRDAVQLPADVAHSAPGRDARTPPGAGTAPRPTGLPPVRLTLPTRAQPMGIPDQDRPLRSFSHHRTCRNKKGEPWPEGRGLQLGVRGATRHMRTRPSPARSDWPPMRATRDRPVEGRIVAKLEPGRPALWTRVWRRATLAMRRAGRRLWPR